MKSLAFALALAVLPATASAQVAAGAIANTFEGPARLTPRQAPAKQDAPPTPALPQTPPEPANPQAEASLRAFIAGAQNDRIDYSTMTDDLAGKVREQSASVAQVIKGLGAVRAVDWMGQQQGADLFVVAFDNAPTEWLVGFNPEGKVAALLFRPAPLSAAPTIPATTTPKD